MLALKEPPSFRPSAACRGADAEGVVAAAAAPEVAGRIHAGVGSCAGCGALAQGDVAPRMVRWPQPPAPPKSTLLEMAIGEPARLWSTTQRREAVHVLAPDPAAVAAVAAAAMDGDKAMMAAQGAIATTPLRTMVAGPGECEGCLCIVRRGTPGATLARGRRGVAVPSAVAPAGPDAAAAAEAAAAAATAVAAAAAAATAVAAKGGGMVRPGPRETPRETQAGVLRQEAASESETEVAAVAEPKERRPGATSPRTVTGPTRPQVSAGGGAPTRAAEAARCLGSAMPTPRAKLPPRVPESDPAGVGGPMP